MHYTQLINLPIGSTEEQAKIGSIKDIIVNPDNGEILGFKVTPEGFFAKDKILSKVDIIDCDNNGIVVKDADSLVELQEIITIKNIIKQNISLINSKAVTESKENLGKINDLLIETSDFYILKYYIKGLWQDKILPGDKVVKIKKGEVIFANDAITEPIANEVEEAAA